MSDADAVGSDAPRWSPGALLVAWSVPVVLGTPLAVVSVRTAGSQVSLWRVLLVVAACWYVWMAIAPLAARLAERRPLERPFGARSLAAHVAAGLSACVAQALSTAVAAHALLPTPGVGFVDVFLFWLLTLLPAGVIVYAAVVGLRTAELGRARLAARERQGERLATQLAEAQLHTLRAQIQPHFLFNTLTAVTALVRDHEAERAADALTQLGTLLRAALRTGATHEGRLGDELAFTTNYLALERMRFGDRLAVRLDVPAPLHDARVPTFLLQPFVENALRHGLRRQGTGGRVEISARAVDRRLLVRVEDDGAGLAADWEARCASGVGVANSRARLRQLYGAEASLRIGPRADRGGGTAVEVTLPLRTDLVARAAGAGAA